MDFSAIAREFLEGVINNRGVADDSETNRDNSRHLDNKVDSALDTTEYSDDSSVDVEVATTPPRKRSRSRSSTRRDSMPNNAPVRIAPIVSPRRSSSFRAISEKCVSDYQETPPPRIQPRRLSLERSVTAKPISKPKLTQKEINSTTVPSPKYSFPVTAAKEEKVEVLQNSPGRTNSLLQHSYSLRSSRSCPASKPAVREVNEKDPTEEQNYMCNISELPLAVLFGGDTKNEAAVEPPPKVDTKKPRRPRAEKQDSKQEPPIADDSVEPEKKKTPKSNDNKYGEKKHLSWFGHGKFSTCFAIFFAWAGFLLAALSRQSSKFVRLETGFELSPQYELVHEVGMIFMEICLNATMMDEPRCEILRLSPDDIDDSIFDLSRSLLGMATALGFVLSLMLTTSIYWESINLKPIGVGFLITYFFQSFSMLFFDTDMCAEYSCKMGPGGVICIVASICWMAACIGTAKMDSFKLRAIRARRREARKKAKAERKARKELKKQKELRELERMTTMSTDSTKSFDEENRVR